MVNLGVRFLESRWPPFNPRAFRTGGAREGTQGDPVGTNPHDSDISTGTPSSSAGERGN